MKLILFYEKPGCSTNAKQKESLKNKGCMVISRNLLQMEMSKEELYSYLKSRSIDEWFNPNAPKIKSGVINPKSFSSKDALALLFKDPILIRRLLVSINGHRMCGFDPKKIENILGFSLEDHPDESCSSSTQCLSPISPATP